MRDCARMKKKESNNFKITESPLLSRTIQELTTDKETMSGGQIRVPCESKKKKKTHLFIQ